MSQITKQESMQHEEVAKRATLGFWIYLMTDCILFAALFATYAVLRNNTFGGPSGADIISLPYVLVETLLLLTSSFTVGLALLAILQGNKQKALVWLLVTFTLGLGFLTMEVYEFQKLYAEGFDWRRSAYLSSFFTLLGTHGLHIFVGLLWMLVLMYQIAKKEISHHTIRRATMFSMFWHFLDIVWIFIFTIVFLMGAI
jgi:cytochrome o ubiquinol oxidase subunit 3